MYAIGIVIDSVSVINVVLAVGAVCRLLRPHRPLLYGERWRLQWCPRHRSLGCEWNDLYIFSMSCFLHPLWLSSSHSIKDIGSSVLNGAISTFLAVAVLLFSKSYIFKTLSIQFALTVGLGVIHGLILLPVLLSLFGPKPFASAEPPHQPESIEISKSNTPADTVFPEQMKVPEMMEHAESLEVPP